MEVLNIESFKEKVFDFTTSKEWRYKGSQPAVIDFYADWCGPCHQLNPILDDTATQFSSQVNFYKINIDQTPELAALFEVRSVPTLLFVPLNGDPAMSSGVVPRDKLAQAIIEIFEL